MRVLHARVEIAGQVALSAAGLRARGVAADAYFPRHAFGYERGPDLSPPGGGPVTRAAGEAWAAARLAPRYDVVHYHFGMSLLPTPLRYADARMLRRLGRRVAVEFWGSEARLPSVEAARNPYYVNAYAEDDAANRARLARWAEVTDGHAIVSDHAFDAFLEPYFPHLHVVGQRVDTDALAASYPDPDEREPVVVHAPNRLAAKGTQHVRDALERLRGRGVRFRYVELSGVSHREVLAASARADLVVDQLCLGSHGVFAAEAMSLGKPVLCHVLPELVPLYPAGFPLIPATPETVERVLEEWLTDGAARHRAGVASRGYAERVHDFRAVADRLREAYGRLPGAREG